MGVNLVVAFAWRAFLHAEQAPRLSTWWRRNAQRCGCHALNSPCRCASWRSRSAPRRGVKPLRPENTGASSRRRFRTPPARYLSECEPTGHALLAALAEHVTVPSSRARSETQAAQLDSAGRTIEQLQQGTCRAGPRHSVDFTRRAVRRSSTCGSLRGASERGCRRRIAATRRAEQPLERAAPGGEPALRL